MFTIKKIYEYLVFCVNTLGCFHFHVNDMDISGIYFVPAF